MRLLNIPNYVCPKCLDQMELNYNREEQTIVIKHYDWNDYCAERLVRTIKSFADFSIEV